MMFKILLSKVISPLKLLLFKIRFRKRFPESHVTPVGCFDINAVDIGKFSYGPLDVRIGGGVRSPDIFLKIGNFVSIASGVIFLLKVEHELDSISTYPFNYFVMRKPESAGSKGPIVVGDDVWIGERAIVMSGVTIGQGAVIAAGAVVTKDVLPYAIVGGVPARIIRYRHPPNIREKLLKIDFSTIKEDTIKNNINYMYEHIDETNVDFILSHLYNDDM